MHSQNKNLVLELKYGSRLGYTKVCSHPQPPTNTHSHPQPSKTTKKPPTTTNNHLQLPKKPPTTIHSHPQPPKNYSKTPRLSQTVMLLHFRCSHWNRRRVSIVIRNNGIYTCVSVCVYILYKSLHWLFFGSAGCLFLSAWKVIHLMLKAMAFVS